MRRALSNAIAIAASAAMAVPPLALPVAAQERLNREQVVRICTELLQTDDRVALAQCAVEQFEARGQSEAADRARAVLAEARAAAESAPLTRDEAIRICVGRLDSQDRQEVGACVVEELERDGQAELAATIRETLADERRAAAAEAEAARLGADRAGLQTALAVAESRAERLAPLEAEVESLRARLAAAEAEAEGVRRESAARLEELRRMGAEVERRFEGLAAQALGKQTEEFLKLAEERLSRAKQGADADLAARQEKIAALTAPIAESLGKVEARVGEIEKAREGAYHGMLAQVRALAEGQDRLRGETAKLVNALRAPKTRGRWGEFQLRRVFEIAGMEEHVDFDLEHTMAGEDGALRPDAVVRLPGGKALVIDAKTPLDAFLTALEAADETAREAAIQRHAAQLRAHVQRLSGKAYWAALPVAPDFVVMFVPGEAFYAAAVEQSPDLFETAVRARVLIATPTTLIALVKAVAYGWREEKLAENARQIAETGRDLFDRIRIFGEHFDKIGRSLRQTVERYNGAAASFESRLIPTARRLETLGAAPEGRAPPEIATVDHEPRPLVAPEARRAEDG
jgi:DNA recombination protein RmuC